MTRDEAYMTMAIQAAHGAVALGERPYGCVIVKGSEIIAVTGGSEKPDDPTNHSEILAIQIACKRSGGLLHGCTLYSTHEPCAMCCGAICHAKISRIAWGSRRRDLPELFRQRHLNAVELLRDTSRPPVILVGILNRECIRLFDQEVAAAKSFLDDDWGDATTQIGLGG